MTNIEPLTWERLSEAVKAVVNRQGKNFIYMPGGESICYYAPQPELEGPRAVCGCIVGEIFKELGLPTSDPFFSMQLGITKIIRNYGALAADMGTMANSRFWEFQIQPGSAIMYFLSGAQSAQDSGKTWGESVEVGMRLAIAYATTSELAYLRENPIVIE